MNDKVFSQAQDAMKPISEMMALNGKIFEEAAEKQKNFFQDMINESMAFAKELSSQKDYTGVYQTQKAYLEGMQEKWIAASTEAYEMMTSSQEKMTEAVKKSTSAQ